MVDFGKQLNSEQIVKKIDPIEIYDQLDRKVDKGPLRPAQVSILTQWFNSHRENRDNIIKLHTGQGKTLIGLLILQSKLNENKGPAIFLCANNFLVAQTCEQAEQFGIGFCEATTDLPFEFLEGKSILICSVQKMFNGLSKFQLSPNSVKIGAIVIDDAHSCIDSIQSACMMNIPNNQEAYQEIRRLFATDLRQQGEGTYIDIELGNYNSFSAVPYWAWAERLEEVTLILAKHAASKSVKFAWPVLKDRLQECQCVISGTSLEIVPMLMPLDVFGSYFKASSRTFMSATVADDALMVKGLRIPKNTITGPIVFPDEKWSGEKMLLLPSLIDHELQRGSIVEWLAKPNKKSFGIVALTPSFKGTKDWKGYGARITESENIETTITDLKNGNFEETLVLANRYDGIDLPDSTCRILIFDSLPYSSQLIDRYLNNVRMNSDVVNSRISRAIEQGLGRSVRGEKDYCAIIIVGPDLTSFLRLSKNQHYFSSQTREQIAIGMTISDLAKEEIKNGTKPFDALKKLVGQSLDRDAQWKAYYADRMNSFQHNSTSSNLLAIYELELSAELLFQEGNIKRAVETLQTLVDKHYTGNKEEKAWYIQEMARYKYAVSHSESEFLQRTAHKSYRYLFKPKTGMIVERLILEGVKRNEQIIQYIKDFVGFSDLKLSITATLSDLSWGVKADNFEEALKKIGTALGFLTQRPDKEWKEGPDNLWGIKDNRFVLFECKNEVKETRQAVNKNETEQMNRSCVWFEKHYPGCIVENILVIPTHKIESAANFTHNVSVLKDFGLKKLKFNIGAFFDEFNGVDFHNLSSEWVQEKLVIHSLDEGQLFAGLLKEPKHLISAH